MIHSTPSTMQFRMPMGNLKAKKGQYDKFKTSAQKGPEKPAAESPSQLALGPGSDPRMALRGAPVRKPLTGGGNVTNRQRVFSTGNDGARAIGFTRPGRSVQRDFRENPELTRGARQSAFNDRRQSTPRVKPEYPGHYGTLGVKPGASSEEIGSAFRKLSRQFHPDTLGPNASPQKKRAAEAKYKRVTEAYNALKTRRV